MNKHCYKFIDIDMEAINDLWLDLLKFGFRRLHSTEAAVFKACNAIVLALDSGFITAAH